MASDYHQTGRGTGYTINSDGTVTRYVRTATNRSSNRRPKRVGWWVFLIIVFVIAAVGIGVYAYYENSYLYVSPSNISIGAEGGTIDVRVNSNRDWYISTGPASWGRTSKYSRSIEWEVAPNTQTSERTDYIDLSCTNCTQRIYIKQAAKKYFNISPTYIEVPGDGSTYSFEISTNESWSISTNTYSWGHLKKNGNSLSLTIDENPMTGEREDYFVIKSQSGIEKRVDIYQSGSYLFTDKNNLIFDYYGTSQSIEVSCGGNWDIDVGTRPWAHLSKDGNTLTLSCDYNPGEQRKDWFTLKSGSLTWRVDFIQN